MIICVQNGVCSFIHECVCTFVCVCVHVCVCMCVCLCMCECVHALVYTVWQEIFGVKFS